MFGYTRAEIIGQPIEILVPDPLRDKQIAHVAAFAKLQLFDRWAAGGSSFGRHRDGSLIPMEVSLSPIRSDDGMIIMAAIRDITERKRTEAVAKLSADPLARAVDNMQDAFALFDRNSGFVMCNEAYRRLAGREIPPGTT